MPRGCGIGAIPLPKETSMGIALLVWLVLIYFCSGKPGWFGCLLVLLVIAVLITGCA